MSTMPAPRRSARLQQQKQQQKQRQQVQLHDIRASPPNRQTPKTRTRKKDITDKDKQSHVKDSFKPRGRQAKHKLTNKLSSPRDPTKALLATGTSAEAPSLKRTSNFDDAEEQRQSKRSRPSSSDGQNPIRYWAEFGFWPEYYLNMSNNASASSNAGNGRKRPRTHSASESGITGPAHSARTEPQLLKHGVIMDHTVGQDELKLSSKALCQDMFRKRHDDIRLSVGYPITSLPSILSQLRIHNEFHVVRDLTPLLVPPVAHIRAAGAKGLDNIGEQICADWNKCKTMGSKAPRPDITVGLDESAFSEDELTKLANYRSYERATFLTNYILFPFLVCEVKSCEQPLSKAGRQSGHSGAMAANAIWQLYHSLDDKQPSKTNESSSVPNVPNEDGDPVASRVTAAGNAPNEGSARVVETSGEAPVEQSLGEQPDQRSMESHAGSPSHQQAPAAASGTAEVSTKHLNGEILVFSVVHDSNNVELYGHFTVAEKGATQPKVYRHLIESSSLGSDPIARTQRIRDFVLELYFSFSVTHLKRIRAALGKIPMPKVPEPENTRGTQDVSNMGPPSMSATQMAMQKQLEELQGKLVEEMERARSDRERERSDRERERSDRERETERLRLEREQERQQERSDKERLEAQISQLMSMVNNLSANRVVTS